MNQTNKVILKTVNKYLDFISPTFGPAGKSILIHDILGVRAIDDGKIASHHFTLEDKKENAILTYIKESTSKTDDRVGDGTTTSAILMSAIVKEVLNGKSDTHQEVIDIQKAVIEAVKQIKDQSTPISTLKDLTKIAYNSFNHEELANVIAKSVHDVGKDGIILVEDSNTLNTTSNRVNGLEIPSGFMSPYFVNVGNEVRLQNTPVCLFDRRIDSFKELAPLLEKIVIAGHKNIAIFAHSFSEDVVNTFVLNKMKGVINPLLVEITTGAYERSQTLLDISAITGAIVIDSVKLITDLDLSCIGMANVVTSKKRSTIITGTQAPVERLEGLMKTIGDDKKYNELVESRIARLTNGVTTINVGATTQNEQTTIKAKVEDAVSATLVAFRGGIVKGGGMTFNSIKTSSRTLNKALKAPRKQLEANGASFLDKDVFDPTDVLVASLQSAVSIACGLIKMGGIITK